MFIIPDKRNSARDAESAMLSKEPPVTKTLIALAGFTDRMSIV